MNWKTLVREKLAALDLDACRSEEIAEELAQDLEQRHREALAEGFPEDEARAIALEQLEDERLLHDLERAERSCKPALLRSQAGRADAIVPGDATGGGWWHGLRQDLRYALRALLGSPGFTIVAVLTLALGVGANTAIFSLADAVLLRPLPYEEPERLFHMFEVKPNNEDFARREASYPDFLDWSARSDLFSHVAGYNGGSGTLLGEGPPQRIQALTVTDNFFDMLGVKAARGRLFLPGESGIEAERLIVLTWGSWQGRFGGDEEILGRSLNISGNLYTVVGVLPEEFQFPLRGFAEFWLPLGVRERQVEARAWHWLDAVARLRPGVSQEQAILDLQRTAQQIGEVDPEWHEGGGLTLIPLREEMITGMRPAMLAMMAAAVLVLLIVCSNLANLLLTRSAARRKEIGVRAALGASRWRLARQLLTESLMLSAIGGLAGILVARFTTTLLLAGLPEGWRTTLPHLKEFGLHLPAFGLTLAIALLAGVLFGLAPAWRATRLDLVDALKEGRGAGTAVRSRLSRAFVISEVALTLMLLITAGLISRSLGELMQVSAGFNTDNLLTARISLPGERFPDEPSRLQGMQQVLEQVEQLPGVSGAAMVSQLPLTGRGNTGGFSVFGRPPDERVEANIRAVSTNYFDLMQVPGKVGREFDSRDTFESPEVVVVNDLLATRVFGGAEAAIGQKIQFGFFDGEPWWEIVGVVDDERVDTLDSGLTPIVYFAFTQSADWGMSLCVRTSVDPASVAHGMEARVQSVDAEMPVYNVRTMDEIIGNSTPVFLRRYLSFLIGGFAFLAALLATVGIYGVTAYSVEQRRHEIGLRMALGAAPAQVVRMVISQGVRLAAIGVGIGLVGSTVAMRALSSLLYGVSAADLRVLLGVSVVLAAIVLIACSVPALRATRVHPTVALRSE